MKKIVVKIGILVSIVAMILIGFIGIAAAVVEFDCPSNTDRPTTGLAYAHSSSNGNTVTYEVDVVNKSGSEIIEYCVYPTPGFTGLDSDITPTYPGWSIDHPGSKAYFGFDSRSAPNIPLDGDTNIPVGEAIYTSGLPSSESLLLHILDSDECAPEGDTSCWRKAMTPLSVPIPPIADPNGPYTGIEGTVINFDGSGSSDPDGSITSYVWNFGDSGTGTGINPSHTYTQNGAYMVTLTVTDNSGATNSNTTTVTITDIDPVSTFSGLPLGGDAPLTVTFTDSSSSYDGIVLWRWDFDSDSIIDSTEQNPIHQYTLAGIYTANLTVCEADGDCDSSTGTITVTSVPTPTPTTPTPTPTGTVTPTPTVPTPTPTSTSPPGDTIRPSQPLCPVAIAINPTTINVSWQASVDNVGVVGYKVYRSIDGTNYYYLTTVTGLNYVDPGRTTGTTYYYVIIAIDAAGNPSLPSDETYATPRDVNPPTITVPSNIIAEATSPSGASATFLSSAIDDIDGAIIPVCNPTSGSTFHMGITTVTCTATDNAGNQNSAIFTITVQDTTPPTPPSGLTATAMSTSRIDLSWTASTDAVGTIRYMVYRSLDGTNFASIGTVTTTTFQNTGLAANTTYYYRIGARDTANNPSANSSIASAKTFAIPPPTSTPTPSPTGTPGTPGPTPTTTPPPTPDVPPVLTLPSNIVEEATSPNGAVVTFSTSADDNEDGDLSSIVTCSNTSGSIFPLKITYVTCTVTDSADNTASGVFSITVQDTTPPTAPSGLTATAMSTSRIDLSWTASTDIVGVKNYRIYRSLNNVDWSGIGTSTGTSFSNMGLTANKTYYYRVQAYDTSDNPSAFSNVASATTFALPPSPPPTPTPTPTTTAIPTPTPTVNPCAPPQLGNTPQGQGVEVPVASTIGVTFDTVLECGDTTAVAYYENEWTALPTGYEKVLFYDIDTSAAYDNTITIKVTYSSSDIPSGVSEQTLRLFHYENGDWVDVTTALDTASNVVTGRVSSLSPFGIGGLTGSGGGGGGGSGTGMRGSGLGIIGIMVLGICLVLISIIRFKNVGNYEKDRA